MRRLALGVQSGHPSKRALQVAFWLLIRAGFVRAEAAAALGLSEHTGGRWFKQAGGVIPYYVRAQLHHRYLVLEEREEILAGVERGDSIRQIARCLGRAPSTILKRTPPKHERDVPAPAATSAQAALAQG